MEQRIDLASSTPDAMAAVFALERHVRSKLDAGLLHLVKLRASIINGCAFCVDMHSTEAIRDGEDQRRVFAVAAWAESPFFTDRERSALALTDAVTELGDRGVDDRVWSDAVDAFGDATAAELVVAIATINVWNRLAISTRMDLPPLAA